MEQGLDSGQVRRINLNMFKKKYQKNIILIKNRKNQRNFYQI